MTLLPVGRKGSLYMAHGLSITSESEPGACTAVESERAARQNDSVAGGDRLLPACRNHRH